MYFIQPRSNGSSRTNSRSNSRSDSYKSSPSSRSNSYNANVSPRSDAYYSNTYHYDNNEYTPRSNTFPSRSRPRAQSYDSSHSLDSSFSVPSICHERHERYRDSYLPPIPPPPPLYEDRHQPIPTGLMMRYKIAKVLRLIPERRRGGKQTTVLRPQAPYEQQYARREGWSSRGW